MGRWRGKPLDGIGSWQSLVSCRRNGYRVRAIMAWFSVSTEALTLASRRRSGPVDRVAFCFCLRGGPSQTLPCPRQSSQQLWAAGGLQLPRRGSRSMCAGDVGCIEFTAHLVGVRQAPGHTYHEEGCAAAWGIPRPFQAVNIQVLRTS